MGNVVYHNKLGSQLERVQRVRKLSSWIAEKLGADIEKTERAAWLSKADLLTDMVGEFPELQGTMGRYYALHDGEDNAVARAIEEHYLPRISGDKLPEDNIGCAVALADRLDASRHLRDRSRSPLQAILDCGKRWASGILSGEVPAAGSGRAVSPAAPFAPALHDSVA